MPVAALSLAVVGANYPNNRSPTRRFEIALCAPGEPIELRLEPTNPVDPYAVAVYSCRDVQLGYLTAERAPWIGGMLANGREVRAVFQDATQAGAIARIAFDGAEPTLPDVKPRPALPDDDGFWPDEIYPYD